MRRTTAFIIAGAACAALAATAVAQQQQMKLPTVEHDYKVAPAGKYAVDPAHTGLLAYVSHLGFSNETFRFLTVSGTLTWDPAKPGADTLDVTVDPKSITTAPVGEDWAPVLSGPKFLNAAKYPTATFVSKSFQPTDASHGKVAGDLTIMGVTKPAVFDVALVGAGSFFGKQTLGVHAETQISPNDYGLPPPFFGAPVRLVIDTEFHKTA
jgi:polyisoprenoid-binding protein YceI